MKKYIFLISILILFQSTFANPYIPLKQPFNVAPWNYNGTEQLDSIPAGTIDWILIEFRSAIIPATGKQKVIYRQAALLKYNGIVFFQNKDTLREFDSVTGFYYIVIYHRGHLPIMSKDSVYVYNGILQQFYDFSKPQNVYGDTNAVVQLDDSTYGMIAGDTNNDGVINVLDYKPIQNNLLKTGYYNGDLDNNGIVNVKDYAFVKRNLFRVSQLPKVTSDTTIVTQPNELPIERVVHMIKYPSDYDEVLQLSDNNLTTSFNFNSGYIIAYLTNISTMDSIKLWHNNMGESIAFWMKDANGNTVKDKPTFTIQKNPIVYIPNNKNGNYINISTSTGVNWQFFEIKVYGH